MEFALHGASSEMTREQEIMLTKKRLGAFQFGKSPNGSNLSAPLSPTRSTGRPHSRNGSISSMSFSASKSANSVLSSISDQLSTPNSESRPSSIVGRSRPNSHHRRRSSVSTRVESAEIMGLTLPDLPASSSEDNINFGDKDSIRRRALLALEGKDSFSSNTNTVEIVDLSNEGVPHKPLDREFKFPVASSSFGLSSHSVKRDSFGKFLSSSTSIKDQLHTLLEEEEEEEESHVHSTTIESLKPKELVQSPASTPVSIVDEYETSLEANAVKNSVSGRHRPANLSLRPLSLISSSSAPALPTPSPTPSTSSRSGLRALSLTPQPDATFNLESKPDLREHGIEIDSSNFRSSRSSQRQSMGSSSSSSTVPSPKRQSSISYIRSGSSSSPSSSFANTGLPTPGPTPTSERRPSSSISSSSSSGGRDKKNSSEEIFLQQSHAALLARIAELERALRAQSHSRPHSRPVSADSNDSALSSEKSDEMIHLVSDLKAERDELHRDIDGWKQRVHDLEHSKVVIGHEKAVLERKLGAEKRENWLKNEKIGLLEIEKNSLNRELSLKEDNVNNLNRRLLSTQNQLQETIRECTSLKEDNQVIKRQLAETQLLLDSYKDVERELKGVREALAAEQVYRQQLIGQLDAAGVFSTPKIPTDAPKSYMTNEIKSRKSEHSLMSVDSVCTTVETDEHYSLKAPFTLKAVEEESEIHSDEDELASYEDDDDLDLSFTSPAHSTSTYDSDEEFPRSLSHLRIQPPALSSSDVPSTSGSSSSPSPTPSPCPTPVPLLPPEANPSQHANRASLSKSWTFPRDGPKRSVQRAQEEIDRFFGCLEGVEDSPPSSSIPTMDNRSVFSQRLQFEDTGDEDMPPFILPVQSSADSDNMLEAVLEEEVEEENVSHRSVSAFPISISRDSLNRSSFSSLSEEKRQPFTYPRARNTDLQRGVLRSNSTPADVPSSPTASSSIESFSSERSSPIITPRVTTPRSLPVSRIPSRSPPTFIQARMSPTSPRISPTPPKRKPVPISPSRIPSLTRTSPPATALQRQQGDMPNNMSRQSSYGSAFIPQLRSSNMNDISLSSNSANTENPKLDSSPAQAASSTWPRTISNALSGHKDNVVPSPPIVPSFSRFLPTFSWGSSKPQPQVKREPAFVLKETQLAKLRESLVSRPDQRGCFVDICQCRNCRGDLISL